MVDISGEAGGVSRDLLGLWEGFVVSSSLHGQSKVIRMKDRADCPDVLCPAWPGDQVNLSRTGIIPGLHIPETGTGWSGHLFCLFRLSLFHLFSMSGEN